MLDKSLRRTDLLVFKNWLLYKLHILIQSSFNTLEQYYFHIGCFKKFEGMWATLNIKIQDIKEQPTIICNFG
ncbi:hypothetical protein CDAR_209921 [Caerostris darwini]|uniref:Uncharacterized protein n=1 Tax=Caerostris darwini TaxID=1538125 RepID=A0AAV4QSA5_9ARAC|nr:hypothetical protein CDAR_209921 [Caerostris darwini]